MTQPSRVIYLPPGIVPAPQPTPGPAGVPSGIPFDRGFFERVLPQSIAGFCSQTHCDTPVVEVTTVDGITHYVNGISGVADSWVALQTSTPEQEHPVQAFIPYQTIFRIEIHPETDARRHHLGFDTTAEAPKPVETAAAAAPSKRRKPERAAAKK
jgi:hypothetical protein